MSGASHQSSRPKRNRDRGESRDSAPPTPPCVRVRTRRFGGLCTPRAQPGEAERVEVGIGKRDLQGLGGAGAPRTGSTAAESRRALADAALAQFLATPARALPLGPAVTAQPPPHPAVQLPQHRRGFAPAELP